MANMLCEYCGRPIVEGLDLPLVIEWGTKSADTPAHLGRPIKKAAHQNCYQVANGKAARGSGRIAGPTALKPAESSAPKMNPRDNLIPKESSVDMKAVIVVLVKENPRKEGTHGWNSFKLLKKGMTVEQYLAAGGRRNDLRWDIEHNYIKLEGSK